MPAGIFILSLFSYSPAAHTQSLTLLKKAGIFQNNMEEHFLLEGQALCKMKLPTSNRSFVAYNMPDNAYMTGIYTGALSMKYAVTQHEGDRLTALCSLKALHLLCSVSGVPGLPARAAWPVGKPMDDDGVWRESSCGKYLWRGDVSTDQVAGIMFGFALAYDLIAGDEEKEQIAHDVTAIVNRVLEHDLRIVDVDDKPTQWGRYGPQYVSRGERMNALLWLQALKVAEHVAETKQYADLYTKWALEEGYSSLARTARRMASPFFPGLINHSDDMLIFLAYVPLLRYEEKEPLLASFRESIRRSWEGDGRFPGVRPEQNPFYAFVAGQYLKDTSGIAAAKNTLHWFPFDMKWNRATIEKYEASFGFHNDTIPRSPEPQDRQPVPIDRRLKTWSAWVQDPYRSLGERVDDETLEYNGHDFLLAYWTGRYFGFLDETE